MEEGQEKELEKELEVILECPGSYILKENDGQEIAGGQSNLLLDAEKLNVVPASGEPLPINYRDIVRLAKADYKVEVDLVSREKLTIFNLGYKFEDFARTFSNLNNEVILKDLLMNETQVKPGVEAELRYIDEKKNAAARGLCELRIYETGLVIIDSAGEFIRIQYSDVAKVQSENYSLVIETENGDSYAFSRMGRELDPSFEAVNKLMNELAKKVQTSLKEMFPSQDQLVIRKAARLMKEGRAARRLDIEAISPGIWTELEKKLETLGVKEEYDYLKSLSQAERICIGIKRGLMGDLTGEYVWFLSPIFSTELSKPGNVVAMEAASTEGSGRATYFFRLIDPEKYRNCKSLEDLRAEVDQALKRINRCLITINFRREPIYLSDEQLNTKTYIGYQRAISKLPALRELRRSFLGRVIHNSPEQWKESVDKLLRGSLS